MDGIPKTAETNLNTDSTVMVSSGLENPTEVFVNIYADLPEEHSEESGSSNEVSSRFPDPFETVMDLYMDLFRENREELNSREVESENGDAWGKMIVWRPAPSRMRGINEGSDEETGQSHADNAQGNLLTYDRDRPFPSELEEGNKEDGDEWGSNHKDFPDITNSGEGSSGRRVRFADEERIDPPAYNVVDEELYARLNAIMEQLARLRDDFAQGGEQLVRQITDNMRNEFHVEMTSAVNQVNRSLGSLEQRIRRFTSQVAEGVRNEINADITDAAILYHTDMQDTRDRLGAIEPRIGEILRQLRELSGSVQANREWNVGIGQQLQAGRESLAELQTTIDQRFENMAEEIVRQVATLFDADRLIRPPIAPQEDNHSQYRKKFVQGVLAGGAGVTFAGAVIVIGLLAGHVIDNQPGQNKDT